MSRGWVKLARSLLDWEWAASPNDMALYVHLLLKANRQPARWQGMDVPAGSLVTSIRAMSCETGISVQKLRTCLEHLISTRKITQQSTHKCTIITICGYASCEENESIANTVTNTAINTPSTQCRKEKENFPPHPLYKEKEKGTRMGEIVFDDSAHVRWLEEFFSDERSVYLEPLLKQLRSKDRCVTKAQVRDCADEIVSEWMLTDQRHQSYNDFAKHLLATIRIKFNQQKREDEPEDGIQAYIREQRRLLDLERAGAAQA